MTEVSRIALSSLGEMLGGSVAALVATGGTGAGVCVALMTVGASWCLVQQVRFRYRVASSPVAPFAVGFLVVATGVFALIALHPESVLPANIAHEMMVFFAGVVGPIVGWSLIANMLVMRNRKREICEPAGDHDLSN